VLGDWRGCCGPRRFQIPTRHHCDGRENGPFVVLFGGRSCVGGVGGDGSAVVLPCFGFYNDGQPGLFCLFHQFIGSDLPSNGDPVTPRTIDANNTALSRPMIGSRQAKKRLQDSKAKRMFPNAEQIRGRPLVSADCWRRSETTAVCESDGDSSRRQYRI
jgi:hypothetical protein